MDTQSSGTDEVGSMLGNLNDTNVTNNRPGNNQPLRLQSIREHDAEVFETLAKDFDGFTNGLLRKLLSENKNSTRRYLSDVISIESPEQLIRMRNVLTSAAESHRGNLFIWRVEGSHTHVVHDCLYSVSCCRCAFTIHPSIQRFLRKCLRPRS